ncbi:MAG: hypothetical protein GX303_09015, partial [Clostridiales bacterium]|nr:hypothetical protein [Clostridiales bacterium]
AEIDCARFICDSGAVSARVYPTVVFYDTELCQMSRKGSYQPLSIEEAVMRTKDVLAVFAEHNIPCIRVGLCAGENLSSPEAVFAGPNHSAVGELAMSALFYDILCQKLDELKIDTADCILTVYAPRGATSKIIGHKGINKSRIKEKYPIKKMIVIEKNEILGYNIKIELHRTGGEHPCI